AYGLRGFFAWGHPAQPPDLLHSLHPTHLPFFHCLMTYITAAKTAAPIAIHNITSVIFSPLQAFFCATVNHIKNNEPT
ncbi:MAG: hypothetical protein RR449_06405, partial [Christensenella sp.]